MELKNFAQHMHVNDEDARFRILLFCNSFCVRITYSYNFESLPKDTFYQSFTVYVYVHTLSCNANFQVYHGEILNYEIELSHLNDICQTFMKHCNTAGMSKQLVFETNQISSVCVDVTMDMACNTKAMSEMLSIDRHSKCIDSCRFPITHFVISLYNIGTYLEFGQQTTNGVNSPIDAGTNMSINN